jgi:Flp pilus assembly CpaE family ATPase
VRDFINNVRRCAPKANSSKGRNKRNVAMIGAAGGIVAAIEEQSEQANALG